MSISLSPLFKDNAVFAKGLPISVFGRADAKGEAVLSFPDGTLRRAALAPDENGRFSLLFDPIDNYKEGGTLKITAGGTTYTASNIAVGIVLLAGGQSNMELMLSAVTRPFPLYPSKRMRFFTESHAIDAELGPLSKPRSDFWFLADGESELDFSAIGYFVAERLARELGATVGVVSCNQGASRIDSWLSPEAVAASGVSELTRPVFPDETRIFNLDHWLYFNKYVHIAAYTYTAVLWYQGESNTGFREAPYYDKYLGALLKEWRQSNPNKALPFFAVELSPFDSVLAGWAPEPLGDWASVRAGILRAAEAEKDFYAVSLTEVADLAEIHPVNKAEVAEKLSNAILSTLYGYSLEYAGPRLAQAKREKDRLTLCFSHAKALRLQDRDGAPAAALCDAAFYGVGGEMLAANPSPLTVTEATLSLAIPAGAVAFKMGYSNAPAHNLYNEAGYLASPFSIAL